MSFDSSRNAQVVNESRASSIRGDGAVEIKLISDLSAEDRIARARDRGIQLSKASNADPTFGFGHNDSHWKDYAGEGTSHYDADVLVSQLNLLREPRFMDAKGTWVSRDSYSPKQGAWIRRGHAGMQQVTATIDDVRQIVADRINELGLDPVLAAEFYGETTKESFGSLEGEQAWRMLPFNEQIKRFTKTAQTNEAEDGAPLKGNDHVESK